MNILIGFCPDCRGIKISTPYALKKNKTNFAILDSLHGDYGDVFTMSKIKFNHLRKKHDLITRIMNKEEFEVWICSTCDCSEICKKIRTFNDACSILKISEDIPDYSFLPELMSKRMVAMYKLIIITKALNEGWEPKYDKEENYVTYFPTGFYNSDQEFPFKHEFGMHDSFSIDTIDYQAGGLLMFKHHGLGNYSGVQFRDLYLDLYQYPESYLNRYQK